MVKAAKIRRSLSWLAVEKIVRLSLGFLVAATIARSLGPSDYGTYNLILAVISVSSIITGMGLQSIVVRDLVARRSETNLILHSAMFIVAMASTILLPLAFYFTTWTLSDQSHTQWVVIIMLASLLLKPLDVIAYFFESKTRSDLIVFAGVNAFLIAAFVRFVLSVGSGGLIYLLEYVIYYFFLIYRYRLRIPKRISTPPLDAVAKIIKHSWPIMFASATTIMYMRTDQIMLGMRTDVEAVALYSVASRLSEVWYMVPVMVITTYTPLLLKLRIDSGEAEYERKLMRILNKLIYFGLVVVFGVILTGEKIIVLAFGAEYANSHIILNIHIATLLFVSMGVVSNQWLVATGRENKIFIRSLLALILNIALNLTLIPTYAGVGAAIATLISQLVGTFLFDFSNKETFKIGLIKIKSLNPLLLAGRLK